MSDPNQPATTRAAPVQPPKEIEVDMAELKRLLDTPANREKVRTRVNRFDRSLYSARLRDTTREVQQRRGENAQQRETMTGYMKARSGVVELAANLALGMSVELDGMYRAAKGLRNKTWMEKNGLGVGLLLTGMAVYFGYLYSPVFRETVDTLFAPLATRVFIGITITVIAYLYWRQRNRSQT